MQVSVESIGTLARRMQVQVPAERVAQEVSSRLKSLSRTARLKGFRPGKAPMTVIERQFGPQVRREVIGDLLQSSFAEAVTEHRLAPAGSPRIEPQSLGEGEDLKYVATFEVYPEIALAPIEALAVDRSVAEVTESEQQIAALEAEKQSLAQAMQQEVELLDEQAERLAG
uniref:trigger factor family protein n=1 Tax=Acidithiobacillus sp. TaxID=1872118 RepID=UPI00262D61C8